MLLRKILHLAKDERKVGSSLGDMAGIQHQSSQPTRKKPGLGIGTLIGWTEMIISPFTLGHSHAPSENDYSRRQLKPISLYPELMALIGLERLPLIKEPSLLVLRLELLPCPQD